MDVLKSFFGDESVRALRFYRSTGWSRLPIVSELIPYFLKTGRPILIISMPRSGSTWALRVLSSARETLPLYEPILDDLKSRDLRWSWFASRIDGRVPRTGAARRAFKAIPNFAPRNVSAYARWRPLRRPGKRPLIKEIHLPSAPELISRFKPLVIHLRRHPVAVTSSLLRTPMFGEQRLAQARENEEVGHLFEGRPVCESLGALQSFLLRNFYRSTDGYPDILSVSHEALCSDPLREFRRLFEFCDLRWATRVEDTIYTLGQSDSPLWYRQERKTHLMPQRIFDDLSSDQIDQVRKGWLMHQVPWYSDAEDWESDAHPGELAVGQ